MGNIQCLHLGNAAKTGDLGFYAGKAARCHKLAQPRILVLACHIVVGVVTRHDHQRAQDDLGVTGVLDLLDHFLTGGIFRLALNRADKHVVIAKGLHGGLHLLVADLRRVGGAVTHKHKRHTIGSGGSRIGITGGLDSFGRNSLRHSLLVLVDDGGIAAHLAQQRFGNDDALKLILVVLDGFAHFVVLGTVHQMGGLHDQIFDTVGNGALQRLLHIVDFLAVTRLHMVDDDLGGKGAADAPIGVGCLQGILDVLDVLRAAAVKRRAEADDQQLVLADFIGIAGIIACRIAGIAPEVIGVGVFALDQLLLGIGQGIPRRLGCRALGIGVGGAGLHIDRVDQIGAVLGGSFIGGDFLHRRSTAFGGGAADLAFAGSGAAAARQQGGAKRQGDGGFFHAVLFHNLRFLSYGLNRTGENSSQHLPTKKRGPFACRMATQKDPVV